MKQVRKHWERGGNSRHGWNFHANSLELSLLHLVDVVRMEGDEPQAGTTVFEIIDELCQERRMNQETPHLLPASPADEPSGTSSP